MQLVRWIDNRITEQMPSNTINLTTSEVAIVP